MTTACKVVYLVSGNPIPETHQKEVQGMNILLSIDDTDNRESIGSGRLLEILAGELTTSGLIRACSNIVRHQLFVHDDVPYTSHNSAMSLSAEVAERNFHPCINYAREFIRKCSAPGSDPGLCVYAPNGAEGAQEILDFGKKAKRALLSRQEAYALAEKTGAHLSEHGGTGDGVIGALAAIGLRMGGSDGRFRGWLSPGRAGQVVTAGDLCLLPGVEGVVGPGGLMVPTGTQVRVADERLKTIFFNGRQLVPVIPLRGDGGPAWTTLSRHESKAY